ncbi:MULTISPECIES: hypothetical protein [unclassified Sulfitobacter]|uniref:hypothetical protein n=1 Tax=unclassified Sulfitobacter TaxID=196795 RepID=UPI0007C31576|nr:MULTISPECIES: hypothetical protein [unclassified Sulfitobacter]KZY53466.1 hypothetical protein A3734_15425 [Sulfitobacter sp. HI0054]TKA84214.1 hypothetical protein FCK22_17215 [Sulfitobacter sp. 15WGC]
MPERVLIWWSTGAASYTAAKIALRKYPDALIVRCETENEDEDNYRFERDAMRRLNRNVTLLKSEEYQSVPDVWDRRKFMAGHHGAPCTAEMKIAPRLDFQRPTDRHIFGYTADADDVKRFKRLEKNFFELDVEAPLIEKGVTKAGTLAMVERDGLALPRTYGMGFPCGNCLKTGCSKASSPDYWALFRFHFPRRFAETAARCRRLGARLTRINGVRIFIDEIPVDWPMTQPIAPACDFLCALAEDEAN